MVNLMGFRATTGTELCKEAPPWTWVGPILWSWSELEEESQMSTGIHGSWLPDCGQRNQPPRVPAAITSSPWRTRPSNWEAKQTFPSLLAYIRDFFHNKKKTTVMTINYHPVHSVVSVLYVRPASALIQFHCPAQPPCSAYWSPHFLKPCLSLTFSLSP